MKNEQLYNRTCDILFEAYFNYTLQHGNQCACAVGNLIAAGVGVKLKKLSDGHVVPDCEGDSCSLLANTGLWYEEGFWTPANRIIVETQIMSTGYSFEQIWKIERAFERCDFGYSDEEAMFNGLCDVIDVLNEIHEVEEDNQTVRFEKHYQSKCL